MPLSQITPARQAPSESLSLSATYGQTGAYLFTERHQSLNSGNIQGINKDMAQCPKTNPEKRCPDNASQSHQAPEEKTVKGSAMTCVAIQDNGKEKQDPTNG
jgi:hypothetical protein